MRGTPGQTTRGVLYFIITFKGLFWDSWDFSSFSIVQSSISNNSSCAPDHSLIPDLLSAARWSIPGSFVRYEQRLKVWGHNGAQVGISRLQEFFESFPSCRGLDVSSDIGPIGCGSLYLDPMSCLFFKPFCGSRVSFLHLQNLTLASCCSPHPDHLWSSHVVPPLVGVVVGRLLLRVPVMADALMCDGGDIGLSGSGLMYWWVLCNGLYRH